MDACPTCGQMLPEARFDFDGAQLIAGGKAIDLTPQEAAFVGFLMKRPGRVVAKDFLITALWDLNEPADPENNMTVMLHRLRRKLRGAPLQIRTHWGHGFSIAVNTGGGA